MSRNIIITGAEGQLGKSLKQYINNNPLNCMYSPIFLSKKDMDITNKNDVGRFFKEYNPLAVINCAAYTNVANAETPEGKLKAFDVNVNGPKILSSFCKNYNSLLIHISTDYVFGGAFNEPIDEDEICYPLNYYGESKYRGEEEVENSGCDYFILRTSWLYSKYGKNFFTNMVNKIKEEQEENYLYGVLNEISVPTNAMWLSYVIMHILNKYMLDKHVFRNMYFHCVPDGIASRYDFLKIIYDELKYFNINKKKIIPVKQSAFKSDVSRPYYSVMSNNKLKEYCPYLKVFNWMDEVKNEIKELMEEYLNKNNHLQ